MEQAPYRLSYCVCDDQVVPPAVVLVGAAGPGPARLEKDLDQDFPFAKFLKKSSTWIQLHPPSTSISKMDGHAPQPFPQLWGQLGPLVLLVLNSPCCLAPPSLPFLLAEGIPSSVPPCTHCWTTPSPKGSCRPSYPPPPPSWLWRQTASTGCS